MNFLEHLADFEMVLSRCGRRDVFLTRCAVWVEENRALISPQLPVV